MRHTERDTESIVEYYYKEDTNLTIKRQPKLDGASKSGSGAKGSPEFIIKHNDYPEIALIVECKRDLRDHDKAEEEAKDYSAYLTENNVATLAVSGSPSDYAITLKLKEASGEILTFNSLLSFGKIIEYIERDKAQEEKEAKEIINFARELGVYLQDEIKIRNNEKPLVIAAIMIALKDKTFRKVYHDYEEDDCKLQMENRELLMNNLSDVISRSLDRALISDPKAAQDVKNSLAFMRSKPAFKHKDTNGHTKLYNVIQGLEKHLFSNAHVNTGLDIIGKFYGEFVSDAGGDGSGLGIVLTPSHITDLMCELAELNIDSDVYDPCTGTGGFLVTAMSKMIKMARTDIGDKEEEEKKIEHIKKKQIYGVELDTDMYSMAIANMIFKGDSYPDLLHGSCFKLEDKTLEREPDMALMNPPYSQKDFRELDFIIHAADSIKKGGKVVAVVPKSVGTDRANNKLKAKLMKDHTLEAIISLPGDVFNGVGTSTIIMIIKTGTPHHISRTKTMFINFEDDGFASKKKGVRVEENYEERKEWLLETLYNQESVSGKSAYVRVDHEDEWGVEAHAYFVDYSKLTQENFIDDLKERLVYEYRSA